MELKDRELKDREVKTKEREREELFLKSIIVSVNDMDKFQLKKINKIKPIKSTWYNWLINYLPESKRNIVGCFKDKIIGLFKTNTPKQTMYDRGKKLSSQKHKAILELILYQKIK